MKQNRLAIPIDGRVPLLAVNNFEADRDAALLAVIHSRRFPASSAFEWPLPRQGIQQAVAQDRVKQNRLPISMDGRVPLLAVNNFEADRDAALLAVIHLRRFPASSAFE